MKVQLVHVVGRSASESQRWLALLVIARRASGRMLEDYKAASEVRLSDPATIAAVQMYEGLGLIAYGRAVEVLNG